MFGNLKSCSVDGLIWRLGIILCHVIHSLGGLNAAAHLWHEFVLELRFRWENNFFIPGVNTGSPDLSSCLLQQKIQMLNCCIQKKIDREDRAVQSGNYIIIFCFLMFFLIFTHCKGVYVNFLIVIVKT